MPDTTRTHWTSDEELLELYVLGRLAAERRKALEEHLNACAPCQARVNDERLVMIGVRAGGREELRRELSDRLSRRSTPDTRGVWRWMAAAAVLIAAVGIWRLLTPVRNSPMEQDVPPTITEQPTAPTDEAAKPAEIQPLSSTAFEPSRPIGRRDRSEIGMPQAEPAPSAAPAAGAAVTMSEARQEAKADAEEKAEVRMGEPEAALASTPSLESWAVATIIPVPNVEASKLGRSEDAIRSKEAKKDFAVTYHDAGARARGPMQIQIRQALQSELPLDQRIQTATSGKTSMPAKILMVGDSLRIELFPQTPFPDREISTATIIRPAEDSVVVFIGRTPVGLRIPQKFLVR